MDMSFTQDPRYQKAVLKLSRLPDYENSAISTAALDAGFAGHDMQRRLQLTQMAANELRTKRRQGMENRQFQHGKTMTTAGMKLRDDVTAEDKRNLNIGTGISTVNAAANAYLGHRKQMADIAQARALDARRKGGAI